jgi:hypothetical protein
MESRYAKDLKKAALAELEEAAASWRDTLEKYQLEGVDDPCMGEICLPWQMDDYRDADVMADEIKSYAQDNIQILTDAMLDMEEWAKVEVLRIKARDKEKVAA